MSPPSLRARSSPSREPDDEVRSARVARLHYVTDRLPGLRRRPRARRVRRGRRWVVVFDLLDRRGHVVRDSATLDRFRKLAVPPAWSDVWICSDPMGHLQATGRDARGRKQYRYHVAWRQERDSTKYERMIDFGRVLPHLRRQVAADLRAPGLPRTKVLATVVRLLETTFMRIGNEEYARENDSFGLTTLMDRHVRVSRAGVRFHFRGKSGVFHDVSVDDPVLARIVRRCRELPGQELFQFLDEAGKPATLGSADVNDYIHQNAGREFTAKDFRTWAGTVLAAAALHALGGRADAAGRGSARSRRSEGRPTNRDVVHAVEQVAERLGNTPAVCRKCYIHPHVIAAYLDGTLGASFARAGSAGRRRSTGHGAEERAVLVLLRSRAAGEKSGTLLARQLRRSLRR